MCRTRILRLGVVGVGLSALWLWAFPGCVCLVPAGQQIGLTIPPTQGVSGEAPGPPVVVIDTGATGATGLTGGTGGAGLTGDTGGTGASGAIMELFDVGSRIAGVVFNGQAGGDRAGVGLAGGGDVDNDGRDDILIGAPEADPPAGGNAGVAYLIHGAERDALGTRIELGDVGGAGGPASARIRGTATGQRLGAVLAFVGDVDGDERDDFCLGVPEAEGGGNAWLVYGSNTLLGTVDPADLGAEGGPAGAVVTAEADGDALGTAVGGRGDFNGDGWADLLVSAPGGDVGGGADAGRVYLIAGRAGLSGTIGAGDIARTTAGITLTGRATAFQAGRSIAGVTDLNGDGLDELAVGSPLADVTADGAGEVQVLFGQSFPLPSISLNDVGDVQPGLAIVAQAAGDMLGAVVAAAGDINGDGRADLLVTAPQADDPDGGADAGIVYVLFGADDLGGSINAADIGDTVAGLRIIGAGAGDQAGASAAGAGDVDGDGIDDLLIGAPGADPEGRADAGEVYLLYGRRDISGAIRVSQITTGQVAGRVYRGVDAGDQAGIAVAAAGDVDGDGLRDFLIAAPDNDFRADAAGQVYLIFGTGRE